MFKIMIPSPLSFFAESPLSFFVMFKIMIPSPLLFFAVFNSLVPVINLKSFVVPCYV